MDINRAIADANETANAECLGVECQNENRQLATWLTELVECREEIARLELLVESLTLTEPQREWLNYAPDFELCGDEYEFEAVSHVERWTDRNINAYNPFRRSWEDAAPNQDQFIRRKITHNG